MTNECRSVFRLETRTFSIALPSASKRGRRFCPRRQVVEHRFGTQAVDVSGAFLMRGLANVRAEFSLTALAYNLRRALNILGVEAMTAAVPPEEGYAALSARTGPRATLRSRQAADAAQTLRFPYARSSPCASPRIPAVFARSACFCYLLKLRVGCPILKPQDVDHQHRLIQPAMRSETSQATFQPHPPRHRLHAGRKAIPKWIAGEPQR